MPVLYWKGTTTRHIALDMVEQALSKEVGEVTLGGSEGTSLFRTTSWVQKARIWTSACQHWVTAHRRGVDTSSYSVLVVQASAFPVLIPKHPKTKTQIWSNLWFHSIFSKKGFYIKLKTSLPVLFEGMESLKKSSHGNLCLLALWKRFGDWRPC